MEQQLVHLVELCGKGNWARATEFLNLHPGLIDERDPRKHVSTAGFTPLLAAIERVRVDMVGGFQVPRIADIQDIGRQEFIRHLLRGAANPDIPNGIGDSPLAYACNLHDLWTVRELLRCGANPNAVNMGTKVQDVAQEAWEATGKAGKAGVPGKAAFYDHALLILRMIQGTGGAHQLVSQPQTGTKRKVPSGFGHFLRPGHRTWVFA